MPGGGVGWLRNLRDFEGVRVAIGGVGDGAIVGGLVFGVGGVVVDDLGNEVLV
jgi:hypothetical protein